MNDTKRTYDPSEKLRKCVMSYPDSPTPDILNDINRKTRIPKGMPSRTLKELSQINIDYNVDFVEASFDYTDYIRSRINRHNLEDPFYIVDLGIIKKKMLEWNINFPRVQPFYAIKCNPHPAILRLLTALGAGFDCASQGEINLVLSSLDVTPSKIIFANPCKPPSHLRFAREKGVDMMTFDNHAELLKIKKCFPNARLMIRILTDDSNSICRFGTKFGTPPNHIPILLQTVKELELNLVGVSFHVGSGCLSTDSFAEALRRAHDVFMMAEKLGMPPLTVLDLGGGFPGDADPFPHPSFSDIAKVMNPLMDELFPQSSGVRIIAEPGRYFAAETHTLSVCIYARRDVNLHQTHATGEELVATNQEQPLESETEDGEDIPEYLYYVNDGVYGSFNCLIFDHAEVNPIPLRMGDTSGKLMDERHNCKIFGPTCDSLDCISQKSMLPRMDVGDWFYFKAMGAYTISAGSEFNGFPKPDIFFVDSLSAYT
eukprot:TRINITY_DN1451_c0_g1_i1.p1 TRINITY_DN1451_c0_g1~~TRINITY_DN1451_c0_g1_i1.p1  ORF type:complete len:486 (+),score=76.85 TRINITY_DN1451_c0_g1_i1:171-1628(+)